MTDRINLGRSKRWVIKIGSALITNEGKGLVSSGDLTRRVSRSQEGHIQDLMNFITGKYPG